MSARPIPTAVREAVDPRHVAQRWQRLELYVRLGLAAGEPAYIGLYLHLGRKVARRRDGCPLAMQRHLLRVLLRSAGDEGLPMPWRLACFEHAAWPLAELRAWCRLHDPLGSAAIDEELERVRRRLPAAPPVAPAWPLR